MAKKKEYDDKFKEFAVRLSYRYGNVMKAARELDIPHTLLYSWRKEYALISFDFSNKQEDDPRSTNNDD